MDIRREDPVPQTKDSQGGGSWIPKTPAKLDFTEQPICAGWAENHAVNAKWQENGQFANADQVNQSNWVESGRGYAREAQTRAAASHCDPTGLIDVTLDTCHRGKAVESEIHGYHNLLMDDADKWGNMSFMNLLAMADAPCAPASTENATPHNGFMATSSSLAPNFHLPNGGYTSSSVNSSLPTNRDSLLRSAFPVQMNSVPNIQNDGSRVPSKPVFDLNSPPRMAKEDFFSTSMSPPAAPITPEKTATTDDNHHSDISNVNTDGAQDMQNKKMQLIDDPTNKELQESYTPEKGNMEEADFLKTPQQKPRRKKHRPKVVIEGQPKRTPKPKAKKAESPEAGTTGKRKYVRRKGVNNPNVTPSDESKNGTDPNTNNTGKRKYVRRKVNNKSETTPANEGTTETAADQNVVPTRSSCRRSLNFDDQVRHEGCSNPLPSYFGMESQAENFNAKDQSQSNIQHLQGMTATVEKSGIGAAYDLSRFVNQELENYLSGHTTRPTAQPGSDFTMLAGTSTHTKGKCRILFSNVTHDKEENPITPSLHSQWNPKSPSDSNCSSSTCLIQEGHARGLKRQQVVESNFSITNPTATSHNSLQTYHTIFPQNAHTQDGIFGMHFPAIHKKKRSEKGQSSASSSSNPSTTASENYARCQRQPRNDTWPTLVTSEANQSLCTAQRNIPLINHSVINDCQKSQQTFEGFLASGSTEKLKKKRSKSTTRVRDLSSLAEIFEQLPHSTARASTSRVMQGFEVLDQQHTCVEALLTDTHAKTKRKKRSKRNLTDNSTMQMMQGNQQFVAGSMDSLPAIAWKSMSPVDEIVEHFSLLDLSASSNQMVARSQNTLVPYHFNYQEHHALVTYQRDGTVVPFVNPYDQGKKKRPRPKVDLDDETNRVWRLLLENINSEGIDGTDDEKAKWWEEERRVFQGRTSSFIARMHLIQGDRRFSPWKGSVVDSVVGVFLTQNVSDHLSSSAFMSLAARFPLDSNANPAQSRQEGTSKETGICVLESDVASGLTGEELNKRTCGEDSNMLQSSEYKLITQVKSSANNCDDFLLNGNLRCKLPESSKDGLHVFHESAVNKSRSSSGDGRDMDDTLSSQGSVISSQNSADSPVTQTAENTEPCSLSYSVAEPAAVNKGNSICGSTSFVKLLQMAGTILHGVYNDNDAGQLGSIIRYGDKSDEAKLLTTPNSTCSGPTLQLVANPEVQETQYPELSRKNSGHSNISRSKETSESEPSGSSVDSASREAFQEFMAVNSEQEPKASGENSWSSKNDANGSYCNATQTGKLEKPIQLQENSCKFQDASGIFSQQNSTGATASSNNIDSSRTSKNKKIGPDLNNPENHPGKLVGEPKAKGKKTGKQKKDTTHWDSLRTQTHVCGKQRGQTANTMDSVDWDAVRCADVNEIADTIKERGMNNMLAERIKDFLNRLVQDHGSIDLEWLRDVPPDKAKEYLLSVRGLGLKSVECVRLLTLHHLAFPVDTNVGRIAVRLGWVPLQPLPESLQLHLLELYPVLETIQKYLWPRLCKLDQRTLYELHYQLITFGKVFCTKSKPNCNACPMRGECRHFASAFASARLSLPAPEEKGIVISKENREANQNQDGSKNALHLPLPDINQLASRPGPGNVEPIIEVPATPEPIIEMPATPEPEPEPDQNQALECDIEDAFGEDPDEIPTIQLNMEEFTQNLQNIMHNKMELQAGDMSKALVALNSASASIPMPKLKNMSRLRTEHQVYELPDSHPLLKEMEERQPDDPSPYLLAIWTPGETANSIQPPESRGSCQGSGTMCNDETCVSCCSMREAQSQTVRGTVLIPCRTAMRGSFPLNGTYFQVNEVFSDHESSLKPIDVPREWLWDLPRRTVYFGTSVPTIFRGLTTEGIQHCFWRGFICVRGFDRASRAPRPLIARLHFPASKLARGKGKAEDN